MEEIKERKYILWLPSWYPTELTPYDGDFIQRHARSVSPQVPVQVFHVIRDRERKLTKTTRLVEKVQGGLTETILYYASPRFPIPFFDKLFSQWKFMWLYRKTLKKLFQERGFPDLVHVHVVYKAGLIAKWINKRWGVPFVLTEQWTIHLPEAKLNLFDLPYAEQHLISRIMDHTELVLPVSKYLGKAMKQHWPHIQFEVVPNVVDHSLFKPVSRSSREEILQLVHISTLTYQKDPESLFSALVTLKRKGVAFRLDLFGPDTAEVHQWIREHGLEEQIVFHGEKPQSTLAGVLARADALVLYSRYETFGCVIIEANACGVPVVVPDTALMQELVIQGVNGLLVKPHNPKALAEALEQLAERRITFDPERIRESSLKYGMEKVGKQYVMIYDQLLDQLE